MPLFELDCMECGHTYETILKHKDDMSDERCPKCNSKELQPRLAVWGGYNIAGNNSASARPNMNRRLKK